MLKQAFTLDDRSNFNKLSTVAILIMHGAGSPTSICNMRYYALRGVILSVQSHFVPGRVPCIQRFYVLCIMRISTVMEILISTSTIIQFISK